jgi:integrase
MPWSAGARLWPASRPGLGNHSFRATGITAYLKNGGTLEKAAQMANHASTRTTQLYDRRREELSLDEGGEDQGLTEVERIRGVIGKRDAI